MSGRSSRIVRAGLTLGLAHLVHHTRPSADSRERRDGVWPVLARGVRSDAGDTSQHGSHGSAVPTVLSRVAPLVIGIGMEQWLRLNRGCPFCAVTSLVTGRSRLDRLSAVFGAKIMKWAIKNNARRPRE